MVLVSDPKYTLLAAEMLKLCTKFDSHAPIPNEHVLDAWATMLEQAFNTWERSMNREDLLASVADWYCVNSQTATIADLIKTSRKRWQERYDRGDQTLQAEYEALCNSKAEPDGLPAPDPYAKLEKRPATDEERKAIESIWKKPDDE